MGIIEGAKKKAAEFFSNSQTARNLVLNQVVKYLEKDPEKNAVKIFELLKKGVDDPESRDRVDKVVKYYNEMPAVREYINKVLTNTNSNCLKKFFTNFFGNATWYGIPRREQMMLDHDAKIPFIMLISPAMRCNLKCTGCYAMNYDPNDDMPKEEVFRIVKEAKEMGIYIFTILGGEPFFTDYLIELFRENQDAYFITFTNGTLFTEEVANEISKLGNCMPIFSLEGFEAETDHRRGTGVFQSVMDGMDMLKSRGVPFGVSAATGNHNVDIVGSEEFVDMVMDKGALMIWYFAFMPIGDNPKGTIDMMLTPEQRIQIGRRAREIRSTKSIYTLDFFNDAPFVGGCIAGKFYCHINAKGDLEPCIFCHFATENVLNRPLIDCFKNNELFKSIRKRQPYNDNLLKPCMMVDNPQMIRDIVAESGAYSTDETSAMQINDPEFMEKIDKHAAAFTPFAEAAFEKDFKGTGNYRLSNFEKDNAKNVGKENTEESTEKKEQGHACGHCGGCGGHGHS